MVRELAWAPTLRRHQATDQTVATVVEGELVTLLVGTKMAGVVLQSTTPTGGIKCGIEVSILTNSVSVRREEEREREGGR